jgi:threonine synthase
MPLLFRSTNDKAPAVNLREAMLEGLAPDGGLYLPEKFPTLAAEEIA